MEVTPNDTVILSEEDARNLISEAYARLSSIGMDDIDPYAEESSCSVEYEELPSSLLPGITLFISRTADYSYREWTERWADPVCRPSFGEGEVEDVWCDGVLIDHDEYTVENAAEISKLISDTLQAKAKSERQARIEKKKALRMRKPACLMAKKAV